MSACDCSRASLASELVQRIWNKALGPVWHLHVAPTTRTFYIHLEVLNTCSLLRNTSPQERELDRIRRMRKSVRSPRCRARPERVASLLFSPWAPVLPQSVFQAGKGFDLGALPL